MERSESDRNRSLRNRAKKGPQQEPRKSINRSEETPPHRKFTVLKREEITRVSFFSRACVRAIGQISHTNTTVSLTTITPFHPLTMSVASRTLRLLKGTAASGSRSLSTTSARNAISKFTMPAMSPTMTSGGIAAWKVKEGQPFSAGDVLLEIETDKATMDVEAQDDGVLAKIVVKDGSKDVDVGKVIAMLAEEGDDISNVEVPAEESTPTPSSSAPAESKAEETSDKSAPKEGSQTAASTGAAAPSTPGSASSNAHHSFKGPLFPSVQRLVAENGIEDAEGKIKGTGVRGMITKGDVLAFLGKAKSPTGSFKEPKGGIAVLGPSQAAPKGGAAPDKKSEPLTGEELRSLIIGGLASSGRAARQAKVAPALRVNEDAVQGALEGYAFASGPSLPVMEKKGGARKEGIRTDDVLWDLI